MGDRAKLLPVYVLLAPLDLQGPLGSQGTQVNQGGEESQETEALQALRGHAVTLDLWGQNLI